MAVVNKLKKEIVNNTLFLYEYLSIYGIDKFNTKKALVLLAMYDEILSSDCYFGLVSECVHAKVLDHIRRILKNNPQLRWCRFDINDYVNMGDPQNIDTYKLLKGRTN